MIIYATVLPPTRLRVRRVDEVAFLLDEIEEAVRGGCWRYEAIHGGSVCNSYGWDASTEVCAAVVNPEGLAVTWCFRMPANKITSAGIFRRVGGPVAAAVGRVNASQTSRCEGQGLLRRLHVAEVHAWWRDYVTYYPSIAGGSQQDATSPAPVPERSPERGNRRKIELL